MKKALLIFLLFPPMLSNAQKVVGLGLDLGESIMPMALLNAKGFSSSIILEIENKKSKPIEFRVGFSDFNKSDFEFGLQRNNISSVYSQRVNGGYVSLSRSNNTFVSAGLVVSMYENNTIFRGTDLDFGGIIEKKLPTETLLAVGGKLSVFHPFKIKKQFKIQPQITVSLFYRNRSTNTISAMTIPGLTQFGSLASNVSTGALFSLPLIYRF